MRSLSLITALALVSAALSAPLESTLVGAALSAPLESRATACFVIGNKTLPAEVQDSVDSIIDVITCNAKSTTIQDVPDVTSGGITFSDINFASSKLTPLNFALTTFATASPLTSTNLTLFQNQLNTYLATEAGIRSVGGTLAIKDPKFFLSFQISRILTAQGTNITDAGQTVEHLLGKVISNAGSEDAATKAKVTALSTQLA